MKEIVDIFASTYMSLISLFFICISPVMSSANVLSLKTISESYFFIERIQSDRNLDAVNLSSVKIDQGLEKMWGYVKVYGERSSHGPLMIRFRYDQPDVFRKIKLAELFPGYLVTPLSEVLESHLAEEPVARELELLNKEIQSFAQSGRIDSFEARYAVLMYMLELSSRELFYSEAVARSLVKRQRIKKINEPQKQTAIDLQIEILRASPFGDIPSRIATAYIKRIGSVLNLIKIANVDVDSELNPAVWNLRDILEHLVDGIYRSMKNWSSKLRLEVSKSLQIDLLFAGHGEGFRALRNPEHKIKAYGDFEAIAFVAIRNDEVENITSWIRSLEVDTATHEYPLVQERIDTALAEMDPITFLKVMRIAFSKNMLPEFATTNEYLRYTNSLVKILNELRLNPLSPFHQAKRGLVEIIAGFEEWMNRDLQTKDHPLTEALRQRLELNLIVLKDESIGKQMCLQVLKKL